jgi:cyclopropane fatty-acyl-phospholipid synthase-like methyltransferase
MTRAAGREGLKILDMEIMRGHFTETLKQWRQAFRQNISRFVRIMMSALSACGNFTLLAANISFAVMMG